MRSFLFLCTLWCALYASAGSIDEIRQSLEESSVSQLQEKVYLHTDNQCYFVGDTLWYKAYVVQAGTLQPTDLSRILYVELLSPDGILVERQTIVVSPQGFTCGQFELKDSLYSGYYELRAYTRWMLNFNVRHHRYSSNDKWAFFNSKMAADFYRLWDGLYSRVIPIYSKPEKPGDYDIRRMYQRPKTRIPSPKKDNLIVNFYPEGGHLIAGVPNNVAFSAVDQYGEVVNVSGVLRNDASSQPIKAEHMGRGSFVVTPGSSRLKADFTFKGKKYTISLPKTEKSGVALRLNDSTLNISSVALPAGKEYGISVLCRGVLKHFQQITGSTQTIVLPFSSLPTGVNDVTVFDSDGKILADRLFFVNHHDQDANTITATFNPKTVYDAHQKIEIPVQCNNAQGPVVFSLSVRDSYTDEPTYNDGNIMTDLLLSSDLRGFIARPAYYFEADDDVHRRHLDLLMQVQGWRKYKWQQLSDASTQLRYTPERNFTIEGDVYKMIPLTEVEPDEIPQWLTGGVIVGTEDPEKNATNQTNPFEETEPDEYALEEVGSASMDDISGTSASSDYVYGSADEAMAGLRLFRGRLRKEVLIEGEIIIDGKIIGSTQPTFNKGHFIFNVPPFYGDGYLNMKAYSQSDSLKKNMASRADAKVYNEDAFPDYYVKRDLFFPRFTKPYDFYENHQPDIDESMLIDTLSELTMENDVHELANVNVKGHRRGRRGIDWKKPAFVMDAYEMYNELTDYGLSVGKLDMRQFPMQVCRYLYGNMNRYRTFNVDGRLQGHTYYRNYSPFATGSTAEVEALDRAHRTPQWYYNNLKLKRLQDIRVFSDYEPRKEDSTMVESLTSADATVDLVLIPDDAVQITYRDRHILFHGFNAPEEFYSPDYSTQVPTEPTDYRRTLYWNPNAVTDENGSFTATFYNNSKDTRIKVSAAGLTPDGKLLHLK